MTVSCSPAKKGRTPSGAAEPDGAARQRRNNIACRAFGIDLATVEPLQRLKLQEFLAVGLRRTRHEAQSFVYRLGFIPEKA